MPGLRILHKVASGGRRLLHRGLWPTPGRFQPYNHTLPDRYPWLFAFAAARMPEARRLLSFGCSTGEEVFSLRRYFPDATIKGIDIDPCNIERCRKKNAPGDRLTHFAVAADIAAEVDGSFDAIFCLAVLVHGDLSAGAARRSDPHLRFADFERLVSDFHRCLKPEGLLFLHTTNFRLRDTRVAEEFDVVLEADPSQMAVDRKFGRDNRLLDDGDYRAVGFRKRRGRV